MYKFYRLTNILKEKAIYNFIYGERSNGKTYAVQEYLLKERLKKGNQCMILRRWAEDIKNAGQFWDGLLIEKLEKMSSGKYTAIHYKAGVYYLGKYDAKQKPVFNVEDVLGYVWDISQSERMKGHVYPHVTNVLFDEFISLSDRGYIPNEVNLFLNEVSTITRKRTNVKFWLVGNTVNPYNPYFTYFNIDPLKIKQGEIYTYTGKMCGGKLAVEFCASHPENHGWGTADMYFEFGDAYSRQMIVGGDWQLPFYPVCERPRIPSNWEAYIEYMDHWLKFEIFNEVKDRKIWAYVSQSEPPESPDVPIFSLKPSRRILNYIDISNVDGRPILKAQLERIFNNKKIWYDSRMSGCWLENYLMECENTLITARASLK